MLKVNKFIAIAVLLITTSIVGCGAAGDSDATKSTTQGSAPSVKTLAATSIYETSALFNGTVNPNGASTLVRFEWGSSQSLGFSTNSQDTGSGTSYINFSESISGLSASPKIFFRTIAQNHYGVSTGEILNFTLTSAPSVTTLAASSIYANSAKLNGTVNPNGASTDVRFEWGTSQSLGFSTNSQSAGGGTSYTNFSSSVMGLPSNTMIFFQAIAKNRLVETRGEMLSFTTLPSQ